MDSPALVPQLKSRLLCLLFLTLCPLLMYFNALKGAFQFDDQVLLEQGFVADLDRFRKEVSLTAIMNRPILLFTFALNNSLSSRQVLGFHLVNLLLHLAASALVFHIVWRLQALPGLNPPAGAGRPANSAALPLTVALLFALHPLNTDAVSYISSRSEGLAAVFYLLTLHVFLGALSSRGPAPGASNLPVWTKHAARGAFCLLSFYLAVASKAVAATLPAMAAVLFWAVRSRGPAARRVELAARGGSPPGGAPVLPFLGIVGLAALAAVFYGAKEGWLFPRDQGALIFGRLPYFFAQCKVIVFYYIKEFLFPFNLNVDVGFPFSSLESDPAIAISLLAIVGVLIYAFMRGGVICKIAVLWFFITLAPTSSFVPINDLAVERRVYLPLSLGVGLAAGWNVLKINRSLKPAFLAFLFLALGLLTVERNRVWVDEMSLWQDAAGKNPLSPRVMTNLGKAHYLRAEELSSKGDALQADVERQRALAFFQKSADNLPGFAGRFLNKERLGREFARMASREGDVEIPSSPNGAKRPQAAPETIGAFMANLAEPHYNLANVYLDLGKYEEAERGYKRAVEINPDYSDAHVGLGSVYNRTRRYDLAVESYGRAIETRKRAAKGQDHPLARLNLGETYGRMGRYAEAIREFNKALAFPDIRDKVYFNLGVAHAQLREYGDAERSYLACLEINPAFAEARFNLGHVYQLQKEWDRAVGEYEAFIRIQGPGAQAYFQIAWSHQQAGRARDAQNFYRKALEQDPGHLPARLNLGTLCMDLKEYDSAVAVLEAGLRLRPDEFVLHRQLGMAYREMETGKAKARDHLARALELNPAQDGAETLRKILKELSSS
ncbi:MAG: tetratricopeptide repeat protein [Nitrospinae bacterium]|nr:tetratricopeptide repeat protein [Nitrospinota bacterium]